MGRTPHPLSESKERKRALMTSAKTDATVVLVHAARAGRFELEQSDRGVATERFQSRGCTDPIDFVHG
jgi:hypothetical protein